MESLAQEFSAILDNMLAMDMSNQPNMVAMKSIRDSLAKELMDREHIDFSTARRCASRVALGMTIKIEREINETDLKALGTKFGKVLFRMLKAVSADLDCTIDFVVCNINLSELSFTYK